MTPDERKRQRELFDEFWAEWHDTFCGVPMKDARSLYMRGYVDGQACLAANAIDRPADDERERLRTIQRELKPWVAHNFGDRPSWHPLLGVQEEIGELAHAYLKRAQGIRTNEDHDAAIRDAVADILIFLMDFCNAEGIDLRSEVSATWERVKQRDWKADTALGTREERA